MSSPTSTRIPQSSPVTLRDRFAQVGALDVVMIVLALVSVGLLSWATFGDVSRETELRLFYTDVAICAVFAAEFTWRWRQAGWGRGFFWSHWYEVLGMIPLSYPELRAFRLLRVVVVLGRLMRLGNRVGGDGFSERVVARLAGPIVEQIKHPITLAVLDEVTEVLRAGHYSHNVASALRENQPHLRAMILEKVKADRQAGRLSALPFHDKVVEGTTDATMRVIFAVLDDPRTDELIGDILRENILQIRHDVRQMGVAGARRDVGRPDGPAPG